MTVQRYYMKHRYGGDPWDCNGDIQDGEGDWVKFSDVEPILDEIERLRAENESQMANLIVNAATAKAEVERLRKALRCAAIQAYQSEVVEPQMADLIIGRDLEFADKDDWIEQRIAEWLDSAQKPSEE